MDDLLKIINDRLIVVADVLKSDDGLTTEQTHYATGKIVAYREIIEEINALQEQRGSGRVETKGEAS